MADSKWQPPMGACWVISWKPPLILGGYVLNGIWTIVQIMCVTYRARPAGRAITSDSYISGTFASQKHGHSSLLSQAGESSLRC